MGQATPAGCRCSSGAVNRDVHGPVVDSCSAKGAAERSLSQLVQSWRQTHVALDRLSLLGDQLAAIPRPDGVRHQLLEDLLGLYRQFEEQAVDDESVTTDLALPTASRAAYGRG